MKWLRTIIAISMVATLSLLGCAEKIPVGLDTNNPVDVSQMLAVYAQLTGKTVEAAKDVREDETPILLHQTRPLTRDEARKLIEQDLRDEAGIVVLHRDRKLVVFGFPKNAKP